MLNSKLSLQAFARAMLEGECWTTTVSEKVGISVDGTFRSIEGCETTDEASGNASASTDGSFAIAVRNCLPSHTACHRCKICPTTLSAAPRMRDIFRGCTCT